MLRFRPLLLAMLGCSSLAVSPAFAGPATAEEAATGKSFFSAGGDANVVPTFTKQRAGEGGMRRMLYGNERDDIPDFQQLRMLPSLTTPQRRELRQDLESTRDQMQVLFGKLKQLVPKGQGLGAGEQLLSTADPAVRAQAMQLRTQIQELRKKSWERIKPKLTPAQLEELAAMRKGELKPATFHEPMTGGGMQ